MANLERIVTVNISLNTLPLFQVGFNTLLIAGPHVASLNRVESVTSVNDLLEMGIVSTDKLYLAAQAAFSQTPRPKQVKIGRMQVDSVTVTPKVSDGATYKVTIGQRDTDNNAESFSFECIAGTGVTAVTICDALKALMDAEPSLKQNITSSSGVLTIMNKTAGEAMKVAVNTMLTVGDIIASSGDIAGDLSAINQEDADWYGLSITSRVQADIVAVADWVETQMKIFGITIPDAGAADAAVSSDTGSKLREGNYYRTHWWYHPEAETEFLDVAVAARCFSIDPGGETWANKRLAGIPSVNLTETKFNEVKAKNGNTYEPFRNYNITQNGKVAAGEWIDIIRFRDWLEEEIKVRVFLSLVNANKVPYTDSGIAIIENQVRGALDLGQRRGGIAETEYDSEGNENPGYVIEVPLATSISTNDKANRVLNDMNFNARPAGAIHATTINGSLDYNSLVGQGA